ncbi:MULTISPECIES: response regulator transcription factor [Methylobacterium]|jgi:FixJ family two-component response regulator|uniref:response regulator transcription factor n=1 Tax=Methylobacterium TaxID=407 RepID=UPI0006F64B09|nr:MULTISPECIES: response regulator transcription factor [Methylobacterium]KQS79878.1 two-component system response regulator [Methylobacterium sp. Leaf361]MBN4094748.1 response regulator transcription factor [Methylobacterium sp. OT2]UIN32865.1 response regulator transcription factor [Methylobacterium oryzae]SEP08219.1 two component transcriptional regulator, LuxR family [Methylobacterium sp. UNC300MFChir4.1]SFT27700.1 two component transcriptional regulator, LuxR family [Methylobacterium sp.
MSGNVRGGAAKPGADTASPLVVIVEDDEGVREGLQDLLHSVGLDTLAYGATRDLLAATLPDRPGCLILDVRLPGSSGLDLQAKLAAMGNRMPIIFMTGHGDIPMTVQAMKAGALDFLTKPFRDQDMLDAIAVAIERDRTRRASSAGVAELEALAATLTAREAEVMAQVVKGLLNKQIAHALGISEITVKIHRGNVMRKMAAGSVADLVRKTELLKARAAV